MSLSLRPATVQDIPAIVAIYQVAEDATKARSLARGDSRPYNPNPFSEERIAKLEEKITDPGSRTIVVCDDDKVIAYAGIYDVDRMPLKVFITLPGYEDRGIYDMVQKEGKVWMSEGKEASDTKEG